MCEVMHLSFWRPDHAPEALAQLATPPVSQVHGVKALTGRVCHVLGGYGREPLER